MSNSIKGPVEDRTMQGDIEAICDVHSRYAWALDNKQWDRLIPCFHPDVDFLASNFGHYHSRDTLVAEFQKRTRRVVVRRHMFSNIYVKVEGDEAVATSYLILLREHPNADAVRHFLATGYYRIHFKRAPEGWQMYQFRYENMSSEGNTKLDKKAAPVPYQQALSGLADAPWGDVLHLNDGRSEPQKIRDLANAFVRASDAKDAKGVANCFAPQGLARINGETLAGADEIARAFCARAKGLTFLTNIKTAVKGDQAMLGAYFFRFEAATGDVGHDGGTMFLTATRNGADWAITNAEYFDLWNRKERSHADVLLDERLAAIPSRLWSWEDTRARESDAREALDALLRYTWGNDLATPDLVRSAVSADVDGIFTLASQLAISDAEPIAKMVYEARKSLTCSFHGVLNPVVDFEIDKDHCDLKAYCFTRRTHDGSDGVVLLAGGAYEGHLARGPKAWAFDLIQYTRAFGPFQ